MKLFGWRRCTVGAMSRRHHGDRIRAEEMPVRLHDLATGLAISASLLKGQLDQAGPEARSTGLRALGLVEDSMAQLRTLTAAVARDTHWGRSRPRLEESIRGEASRLKIRLDIKLSGEETWLAPNLADLILLLSREGLRNVRRHAGTSACKIAIDLTNCPFSVRISDWGAGLTSGAKAGGGIQLLQQLASDMGCQLGVASQPGLGTDLVLVGPLCQRERADARMRALPGRARSSQGAERTPGDGERTAVAGQFAQGISRLER